MARKTRDSVDRQRLLDDLSRFAGGGAAEYGGQKGDRFFKNHLPIREHRRVLERETLLVLGGRGTGKSQLFDVLQRIDNPLELLVPDKKAQQSCRDHFRPGYTTRSTDFPTPEVLGKTISNADSKLLQNVWRGLLVGVLLRDGRAKGVLEQRLVPELQTALVEHLARPSQWLPLIDRELECVAEALDRVDDQFRESGEGLTVTYDDLDLLAGRLADVYPLVRELLAFWLRSSRRWTGMRCKVFLRTDIFEAEGLAFTDSSKLRPLSVTLSWNADNLYRLVLKRLLNGDESGQWRGFLVGRDRIPENCLRSDQRWGIVPETTEPDHRVFMERLIGKWMGSGKRKGDTYGWFLNHLQDSLKDIAPRSFLNLFEFSAQRQLTCGLPDGSLLSPEQIAGALEEVSKARIKELNEELSWIDTIGRNLKGQTVPIERDRLRSCIAQGVDWEKLPEQLRNKPDQKDRLIEYLISLGIFRETADKRIHVPDIYLFGFGLKRKGGIRRPRV
jgi:hypothetical protein